MARESDAETGLYYYRARYYDPATGRFLTEDPLGFGGVDGDFYRYTNNSPSSFVDPFGLQTTVIIVYDQDFGITYGAHAALLIDNGGNPTLYDPAGGYGEDNHCEHGCQEYQADPKKYKRYHEDNGSTLQFFIFNTTPEEEKQILARIDKFPTAAPFFCSAFVSDAIKGIGPFKNLRGSGFPGNLADQLYALQHPGHGGKK
jgi:RHS repeat-associated protein